MAMVLAFFMWVGVGGLRRLATEAAAAKAPEWEVAVINLCGIFCIACTLYVIWRTW